MHQETPALKSMISHLGHTLIPYAVKDGRRGYLWPVVTGCAHGTDICPTSATCWARTQARRNLTGMKAHYNSDFSPKINLDLLPAIYRLHRPSLILVAFTGELWGSWIPQEVQWAVWLCMDENPQHTFVFLTKDPRNLSRLNPWPDNAWAGVSITGAEPPNVQRARYRSLLAVEGGHRWLSCEPTLGPLALREFPGLSWVVIGGQSGKGAVRPNPMWVADAEATATEAGIPVYRKPNLSRALGLSPREELPWTP